MNPLLWPKQLFLNYGSRLAIFLVKRRLRKRPQDPGIWLLLARLYETREALPEARNILITALKMFPENRVLKAHLNRLQSWKKSSV